jgi:hypothetical protein
MNKIDTSINISKILLINAFSCRVTKGFTVRFKGAIKILYMKSNKGDKVRIRGLVSTKIKESYCKLYRYRKYRCIKKEIDSCV